MSTEFNRSTRSSIQWPCALVHSSRNRRGSPSFKVSPFIIDKALRAAAGDLKTVKRLQKGDILLEASTSVQSRSLSRLKDLGGCPVSVTPHRTLNSSKGVIHCRDLVNCDKEEILSELREQGVTDINNITRSKRLWRQTQYKHICSRI